MSKQSWKIFFLPARLPHRRFYVFLTSLEGGRARRSVSQNRKRPKSDGELRCKHRIATYNPEEAELRDHLKVPQKRGGILDELIGLWAVNKV